MFRTLTTNERKQTPRLLTKDHFLKNVDSPYKRNKEYMKTALTFFSGFAILSFASLAF